MCIRVVYDNQNRSKIKTCRHFINDIYTFFFAIRSARKPLTLKCQCKNEMKKKRNLGFLSSNTMKKEILNALNFVWVFFIISCHRFTFFLGEERKKGNEKNGNFFSIVSFFCWTNGKRYCCKSKGSKGFFFVSHSISEYTELWMLFIDWIEYIKSRENINIIRFQFSL